MFLSKKKITYTPPNGRQDLRRLLLLLQPQLGFMLLAAFFMAITAVANAGYAYLVGPVLKSLFLSTESAVPVTINGAEVSWLSQLTQFLSQSTPFFLGGVLIAASVVKGVAFLAQRLLVIRAGQRVLYMLRQQLYDGVLTMNPLQRDKDASGNLISRFTVDSHVVEQAVTSGMMAFVSNILQSLALVGLAVSLSPVLSLLGLIAFPPIALVISKLGRLLRKRQGQFYDAYHAVSQQVDESVRGLGVLQSFNAEKFARKRFDRPSRILMNAATAAYTVPAISSPLNEILGATALGVTLWYAQVQISAGSLSPEAFISFFTALFLLYRPIKGLGSAVHALQSGLAAMDKLSAMLSPVRRFVPRHADGDGAMLTEVTVGYRKDMPVLKALSMVVQKGDTVAIVGESGSGKSTLMNVLCGYLEPDSGTVKGHWPVALVPQIPFLFDDTIYMNVSLGNPEISTETVAWACRQAGVMAIAEKFDAGLQYSVGQNGENLSAGERQRVCLARALASGRDLLLLDEITASLDGRNEDIIIESLSGLGDKTVIAVTHRAKTALWAKRTLVLDDGKIVEQGPFKDLLKKSRVVRRLFAQEVCDDEI
ncbi:MAG: ABC transporter ATP-binding protein [Deltaproteobacteria bacterium]|nr:ABC transporter ATP-binding protein [Deltaproteobacteria bacterium]